MQRIAPLLTAAALVVAVANLSAQKPNFAGNWIRITDPNAPTMGGRGGPPDALTIEQDSTTLAVTFVAGRGKNVVNLDGSETKRTLVEGDGSRSEYTSHAAWNGSTLVVTSIRAHNGTSSTATFSYSLDASGHLAVVIALPALGGRPPMNVSASYRKA